MKPARFAIVALAALGLGVTPAAARQEQEAARPKAEADLPPAVSFSDNFESGRLDAWQFPFSEDWVVLFENGNQFLHMIRARDPRVPRRPMQFALQRNLRVGSFSFHARVRRLGKSLIVVFGYTDTLHFYYAHLSEDRGSTQPVHNGIFKVDGGPRVRIAGLDAPPALPDGGWHRVHIVRDAVTGKITVWSDVSLDPLFTVTDRAFVCGKIGIGSFDETADFDDVEIESSDAACKPG